MSHSSQPTAHVESDDPLLRANPYRFTLLPIQYPTLYDLYKKHMAIKWEVEEIDLESDRFSDLNDDEQYFLKHILAFFAGSDGIVMENLGLRFLTEVQVPEARAFYSCQLLMENVHSETYSLLIDTYVKDPDEKLRLFRAIETIPCVQEKARWALSVMHDHSSFAERLVGFAVVEGLFFSGSFCALFWLRTRNLLPGLTFSNELIARDEGLHCKFACELYRLLQVRCSEETVQRIVREAVVIETRFVVESLPVSLIGMNASLMTQYIQCVADSLLLMLGCSPVWKVANPFPFMEQQALLGKTNFFGTFFVFFFR